MMKTTTDGTSSAEQRARIEAVLTKYPDIDADALAELLKWFRKEASALDVGMIASDPQLIDQYRAFKADHLDPFSGADVLRAIAFVVVACGAVVLIVWGAL